MKPAAGTAASESKDDRDQSVEAHGVGTVFVKGVELLSDGIGTPAGLEGSFVVIVSNLLNPADGVSRLRVPRSTFDWWIARMGKWVDLCVCDSVPPALRYVPASEGRKP